LPVLGSIPSIVCRILLEYYSQKYFVIYSEYFYSMKIKLFDLKQKYKIYILRVENLDSIISINIIQYQNYN